MPVGVIFGGQFGSESKGKVAHFWAKQLLSAKHGASNNNEVICVRTGGPNAGHTVIGSDGKSYIFKQLPTPALLPRSVCVLGAGAIIDLEILKRELEYCPLDSGRLLIDPNAAIMTKGHIDQELNGGLRPAIGSTNSGTGAVTMARLRRDGSLRFAKDEPLLKHYVKPTVPYLRDRLDRGGAYVLLEGTQGWGLSVLHCDCYPFCTSRDTGVASFLSEAGLSPFDVKDVIMVIRAFPIRVGGNSGPLPNEIDWQTVTEESGSPDSLMELTSVTKTVRRVARFDAGLVRSAIASNKPSLICLNHVDQVDYEARRTGRPTQKTIRFILQVEDGIGQRIDWIGLGPNTMIARSEFDED
jgi:adenylosuccinate synthase